MIDGVAESPPFEPERLERRSPRGGQVVVPPGRAGRGFLPGGLDEPVATEAAQQRIDRPFTRNHAVHLGQAANEVEPVALLVGEQREHAVLQRSPAHLSEKRILLGYHALQGTWDYLISQRTHGRRRSWPDTRPPARSHRRGTLRSQDRTPSHATGSAGR